MLKRLFAVVIPFAAVLMILSAQETLPEGEGRELVEAQCGSCHGLEAVTAQRADKNTWGGIVEYMLSRGMIATDEEIETMINYLAASFPPDPAKAKGKGK